MYSIQTYPSSKSSCTNDIFGMTQITQAKDTPSHALHAMASLSTIDSITASLVLVWPSGRPTFLPGIIYKWIHKRR
jgi:hypothetical protein